MARRIKVISSLNSSPPVFLRKLANVSRPTSMMRAPTSSRRRGFIQIHMDPSIQLVNVALSDLQLALLAMAHNEIKKIAGIVFKTIKDRSGPTGGIKSSSLSKSWRMRLYKRAALSAIIYTPGKKQNFSHIAAHAGVLLFGYGIYTKDRKFLEPIKTKSGPTDLLEILEYGSRPHVIGPKKSRGRLKFFWEGAEPMLPVLGTKTFLGFFGQRVKHPGTRPYGFTRIAVAEAAGAMIALHYKMKRAKFMIGR
jgi:hypothetical protein